MLLLKTFTIHCRGWRTQIVAEGVYPEKHFLCGRNPPPLPSFTLQAPLSFLTHVSEKERGEEGRQKLKSIDFFRHQLGRDGGSIMRGQWPPNKIGLKSSNDVTYPYLKKNWTEGILMTFGSVSTHKSHWHSMMLFLWRK